MWRIILRKGDSWGILGFLGVKKQQAVLIWRICDYLIASECICGSDLHHNIIKHKVHTGALAYADHQEDLQTLQQTAIKEIHSLIVDQEAEVLAFGDDRDLVG